MKEAMNRLGNFFQCLLSLGMFIFLLIDLVLKSISVIDSSLTDFEISKLIVLIFLFTLLGVFSIVSASAESEKTIKLFSCFDTIVVPSIIYFSGIMLTSFWVVAITFTVFNFFNGLFFELKEEIY